MSDNKVQQLAIERAVQLLKASGAKYKIVLGDVEYGDLEIKPPKKGKPNAGRRNAVYAKQGRKHGDISSYMWPLIKDMQVGDVVAVPFNGFDPATLQSAISAKACHEWGNGSSITSKNKNAVDILRVL